MNKRSKEYLQPFRPRARILQLLGDELIGNPRLAIFELVKNAYDADAKQAVVTLDTSPPHGPRISVQDDGSGMSVETLRDVWLVPGDDHRKKDREANRRSPRFNRLPLGEKGLGRFAVHKLGNHIRLATRPDGGPEATVEIDWNRLVEIPYLDSAPVSIRVHDEPQVFLGSRTGTRIEITELREQIATRGDVRRLHRQITSICSPFDEPGSFTAVLRVPEHEEWLEGVPDVHEILSSAIWKFSFELIKGRFTWSYEFHRVPGIKVEPRRKTGDGPLQLPRSAHAKSDADQLVADEQTTRGIGAVRGELYVYDRDKEIKRRLPSTQAIFDYLDENGGVRVYRDGIRVYNYGEPGDDWLGLDLRRVNRPTRNISQNIVLGAVHLSVASSQGLIEKTNREGFVENQALDRLRSIILGALAVLESERQIDKRRIRGATSDATDPDLKGIASNMSELRSALEKRGVRDDFERYLSRIESDYRSMQETLLTAGMSGLNLAVVFHEVERGVRALHSSIVTGASAKAAADQARELMRLLDGFSALLRKDRKSIHSSRKLIEAARQFNVLRLRHHHVRLVCPLLESPDDGFEARFAFGLVLGALNNLIDNSLYWMRVRWPDSGSASTGRRLFIGQSLDIAEGPAIIVADTGPGFEDPPDRVVQPFFSRKPDGMGLGLYYSSIAMELNGGQLAFPARGEVDLPRGFDGACVALVFQPQSHARVGKSRRHR